MTKITKLLEFLEELGYDTEYVCSQVFPDWFCEEYFVECPDDSILNAISYCSRRLGLDYGILLEDYYHYLEN